MTLTDQTVSALLAAFRSSSPTPGGGSASALAAAVGASLLAMVAGLPKPRAATEGDAGQLADAGRRCADAARRLEGLVDEDARAYELVMAAYRLPKATDQEKTARAASIQDALVAAIEAPLAVMRAGAAAVDGAAVVAKFGNRNASSDVQVALELLAAGVRGAGLNVEINLAGLKNGAAAERVRGEASRLLTATESGVTAARAELARPA